jgi:RNA polymerase sigma factor (sigma-70 family)
LEPFVRSVVGARANALVGVDDLMQAGTIGLLRAIDAFDPAAGSRFTTYAWWWIDGEVRRALREARLVRLPAAKVAALGRIDSAEDRLWDALGREPTTAEVASEIGMSEDEVIEASGLTSALLMEDPMKDRDTNVEPSGSPLGNAAAYSRKEVRNLLEQYAEHCARLEPTRRWNRAGRRPRRALPSTNLQPRLIDVQGALEHLPDTLFATVELVGFYGLGCKEAGRRLGVHENTARNRYRHAIGVITDYLNGLHPLPKRLRTLDWAKKANSVRSLRHVIGNYKPFFRKLERLAASDPSFAGLEVGWVLDRKRGWVPVISEDIGEAARRMAVEVHSLPAAVGNRTTDNATWPIHGSRSADLPNDLTRRRSLAETRGRHYLA